MVQRRRRQGPEGIFQAAVMSAAGAGGFHLAYHTKDSRGSSIGYPDLHLLRVNVVAGQVVSRRSIFAELKGPKGTLSADQTRWLDVLALAGQETYLWRSTDDYQAIADVLRAEHDPGPGAFGRWRVELAELDPVSLWRWEALGAPKEMRW